MVLRDPDLIKRLAAYDRGDRIGKPSMRSLYLAELEREQAERDTNAETRLLLPRDRRRRIETRDLIHQNLPTPKDLRHIHSVVAICGLPYSRLPSDQRDYSRRQGNMALDITSGMLRDERGGVHVQPVPFGPKARLILMHLCSESIRQSSATIEIADTFTGFVRDMGFADSGGRRGPLTAFKEQLNALAACTMRLSVWNGERVRTRNISPIEEMDLWLQTNPDQRSLWPSTVTFSPAMYDSLKRHAMPLNAHVIRALAGSARKLDLYFWLSWRLHALEAPLSLGWSSLYEQFGGQNANVRDFKRHFKADLEELKDVLAALPATLDETGLTIRPADQSVLALPKRYIAKR